MGFSCLFAELDQQSIKIFHVWEKFKSIAIPQLTKWSPYVVPFHSSPISACVERLLSSLTAHTLSLCHDGWLHGGRWRCYGKDELLQMFKYRMTNKSWRESSGEFICCCGEICRTVMMMMMAGRTVRTGKWRKAKHIRAQQYSLNIQISGARAVS